MLEDGKERWTSATFKDGRFEASCFLLEEVGGIDGFRQSILPDLAGESTVALRIATISVKSVRAAGLWLYQKPEEYKGNPAHIVICRSEGMSASKYAKNAGRLKDDATLH